MVDFEFRSGGLTFWVTTALYAVACSLLCAVVLLFQSKSATEEQWIAAQRACAHYHYRAERENCLAQWRYMPLKR